MLASKLFAEDQTHVVSSKKFRRDFWMVCSHSVCVLLCICVCFAPPSPFLLLSLFFFSFPQKKNTCLDLKTRREEKLLDSHPFP